jgi:hypothetical protein
MTGNASVRTKSLLLIAALAAGTLLAAGGATAQIRSDLSAGVSHLMVAVESARIPQADIGTALDDFAWNGANGESHVVKTGVWGSIKNGVKKAAKAVGSAGKRAGIGVGSAVKKAAKAVANSPFGDGLKRTGKGLKKFGTQAYNAGKKYLLHKN